MALAYNTVYNVVQLDLPKEMPPANGVLNKVTLPFVDVPLPPPLPAPVAKKPTPPIEPVIPQPLVLHTEEEFEEWMSTKGLIPLAANNNVVREIAIEIGALCSEGKANSSYVEPIFPDNRGVSTSICIVWSKYYNNVSNVSTWFMNPKCKQIRGAQLNKVARMGDDLYVPMCTNGVPCGVIQVKPQIAGSMERRCVDGMDTRSKYAFGGMATVMQILLEEATGIQLDENGRSYVKIEEDGEVITEKYMLEATNTSNDEGSRLSSIFGILASYAYGSDFIRSFSSFDNAVAALNTFSYDYVLPKLLAQSKYRCPLAHAVALRMQARSSRCSTISNTMLTQITSQISNNLLSTALIRNVSNIKEEYRASKEVNSKINQEVLASLGITLTDAVFEQFRADALNYKYLGMTIGDIIKTKSDSLIGKALVKFHASSLCHLVLQVPEEVPVPTINKVPRVYGSGIVI